VKKPRFTPDQVKFLKDIGFDEVGKMKARWYARKPENYHDTVQADMARSEDTYNIHFSTLHGKYGCTFLRTVPSISPQELAQKLLNVRNDHDETKDFCELLRPKIRKILQKWAKP